MFKYMHRMDVGEKSQKMRSRAKLYYNCNSFATFKGVILNSRFMAVHSFEISSFEIDRFEISCASIMDNIWKKNTGLRFFLKFVPNVNGKLGLVNLWKISSKPTKIFACTAVKSNLNENLDRTATKRSPKCFHVFSIMLHKFYVAQKESQKVSINLFRIRKSGGTRQREGTIQD